MDKIYLNKERAKLLITLLQAGVDGKLLQCQSKSCNNATWYTTDPRDVFKLSFNFEYYNYRIKPSQVLRPFTHDEVPVGARVKFNDDANFQTSIIAKDNDGGISTACS